jgi:hypothetical protein
MKYHRIFPAIAVLVLASLACQTLSGGNKVPESDSGGNQPDITQPTPASNDSNSGSDSTVSTDFPMTDDAFNVTEIGDGSLLYYTRLSGEEAMDFYRQEYTSRGYTEREILTVIAEGTFSIVFDGDPSGKAVVIQSVDLGDGTRTISIRLEEV